MKTKKKKLGKEKKGTAIGRAVSAVKKAIAKGDGKNTGTTTGKRVTDFWNTLLANNVKTKATDADILAALKAEFPGREMFQPIGRIRSFFNRGAQGYGNPPGTDVRGTPKQSFAYDANGNYTKSESYQPAALKKAKKKAKPKKAKKAA